VIHFFPVQGASIVEYPYRLARRRVDIGTGMSNMKHVYRFRPLKRLLDYDELINQEIYFASPEELNDPMEGFRDVIWQGDGVLWTNLFRHYLRCLHHACIMLLLSGEEHPVNRDMMPVFRENSNITPQHQEKTRLLTNRILGLKEVTQLINALATRSVPIRRSELGGILRCVHIIAIDVFAEKLKSHNKEIDPLSTLLATKSFQKLLSGLAARERLVSLANTVTQNPDKTVSVIFDAAGHISDEIQFIQDYNSNLDDLPNRRFVIIEFPTEYIARIEDLVFPRWYAACFMSESKDPSVWGTYGDGHKSICLKFKVHEVSGLPTLRIRRKNGYSGRGDIIELVHEQLNPVTYDSQPPQIDFFRSIGRLPMAAIEKDWFTDQDGRLSTVRHASFDDQEQWRGLYWQEFVDSVTRKFVHWKSENEHRIVIDDAFWSLAEPKSRVARYEFSDLEGIVFGLRTPLQARMRICKIIEDKCAAVGRDDFKFYQAYYSSTTGQVEHREMKLKFSAIKNNS
jgi:hypothetical protein